MTTVAPDGELVSPVSGRMVFRGHDDLRVLMAAVYGSLSDLEWEEPITRGRTHVVLGEASVGRVRLTDAMVLEVDDEGRIARIRPHLRPWLGLTAVAMALGPKLARHPGVVRRALRARGR